MSDNTVSPADPAQELAQIAHELLQAAEVSAREEAARKLLRLIREAQRPETPPAPSPQADRDKAVATVLAEIASRAYSAKVLAFEAMPHMSDNEGAAMLEALDLMVSNIGALADRAVTVFGGEVNMATADEWTHSDAACAALVTLDREGKALAAA
jgi:hypothetical protein